ncbi:MAG: HTH domain-containing protein [Myxococcales bacterium]|nr:HTH domain-containing protein [Myxococcales bacterium]MDH3484469.1 HTH domain-containing protein [Myxococcales bacterium]
MTFTEAAVEVLRLTGKPLHYKKITEIAIERNLLSHVGKTPETTMSSRLATMVKKDRGDAPIIKVKPGVFALRELDEDAAEDLTDDEQDEEESNGLPEAAEAAEAAAEVTETESEEPADEPSEDEPSFVSQEHPGADFFPKEEDDDELILANLDDESRGGAKRPRKRRPRRRRERDEPRQGAASEGRSPPRDRPRREPEPRATRTAEPGEAVGRDLADAIEQALRGRGRQPRSLFQVAEALIASGRLSGGPADLAPTLAAAIRGDNARRRAAAERRRFRESNGSVSLLEWDYPIDAVKSEEAAVRAARRQQEDVRRAFIKRLRDFPDGALLELIATWLNAMGVHSLRGVRAETGDFSLAGTLRRGPEETPLAITIHRGKQPLTNDAIVALRGALHQFDHARIGWVITLGQVREGIYQEAHTDGAAPCAVFDGDALARSMEEVGVGIQRVSLPLAVLDVELLDSLGGPARAYSSDDTAESNGSKRRRSRRRVRRRSPRDQGGEGSDQEDSAEARKPAQEPSDAPESDAPEPIEASEPTEDKEKLAAEAPRDPNLDAEQV